MSAPMQLTAAGYMTVLLLAAGTCLAAAPSASGGVDVLAPWRTEVQVRSVSPTPDRHTIHSYYVCNPESPDGRRVLFYASSAPNGYTGELCVLDRHTGKELVLVRNVTVEDAHRAACQQWLSGGKRVAFHDVRQGRWRVAVVDIDSRGERTLAYDRQLGFGHPLGDVLPIYGCHWKPGQHRDLELVSAITGGAHTVTTAREVTRIFGKFVKTEFGGEPISIFFPVISPDQRRVFFKLAAAGDGSEFRSKAASHRQGLLAFDLDGERFLMLREKWGHPAWHPDSRHLIEVGNLLIDTNGGTLQRIPDEPKLPGCHPSVSPDGKLFVMDGTLEPLGGKPGEWGIVVGDLAGGRHVVVHRFDNSRGAQSWRRSHPHPAFSADGRRIYFNVSSGPWTQLYVAECNASISAK